MTQKTKQRKKRKFFSRKLDGTLVFSLAALMLVPIYVWSLREVHSDEVESETWSADSVYIAQEREVEEKEVPEEKVKSEKSTYQYSRPTYGLKHPFPLSSEKDSLGRNVCAKPKDKPGESKQNKSVHIDFECCLDPDEIPNAHCYYDSERYRNLLDKYEKNKEKMLQKHKEGKKL